MSSGVDEQVASAVNIDFYGTEGSYGENYRYLLKSAFLRIQKNSYRIKENIEMKGNI